MAKEDVDRIADAYSFVGKAAVQGPVRWIPKAWQTKLGSLTGVPEVFITTQQISRGELLRFGGGPLESRDVQRGFFISTMAWGYGRSARGPWRVNQMLNTRDAPAKIELAINRVRRCGAVAGYKAIARGGDARLRWMGPSFGTKLLYFAEYTSSAGPKPLILDRVVGRALDRFGVYLHYNGWDAADYEQYLTVAHQVAERVGVEPHDVEWWLFQIGRTRAGQQDAGSG